MKKLQKLPEALALQRDEILRRVVADVALLVDEFDGWFTVHEIEGMEEIALHPQSGPPDDYFRAYLAQMDEDQTEPRLILDDVILDQDVVDLTMQIVWDEASGGWGLIPVPA